MKAYEKKGIGRVKNLSRDPQSVYKHVLSLISFLFFFFPAFYRHSSSFSASLLSPFFFYFIFTDFFTIVIFVYLLGAATVHRLHSINFCFPFRLICLLRFLHCFLCVTKHSNSNPKETKREREREN